MANSDRDNAIRASVQMWCATARVALQTDDIVGVQTAALQLNNLALDITIPAAVRDGIRYFVDQLGTGLMDGGLKQLEQIVRQFDPDTAALNKAIDVAQAGGAALSIPRAAAAAQSALSSFQQLQQAFGQWQQSPSQNSLDDLVHHKEQLIAALQYLATRL